jgi:hypothetical protein
VNPLTISSFAFFCVFGGALLGMFLRRILPETHLSGDSRDTVKVGTAFISTLTALVLGLLVGSAKGTLDTVNAGITQIGAKLILLDRVLARYGPETRPTRDLLRRSVVSKIEVIWPEHGTGQVGMKTLGSAGVAEAFDDKIRELSPRDDAQRALQSQALQISTEFAELRWLLFAQRQGSVPGPLLAVLLSWLTIIFTSLGLLAPRNATVVAVLFVCALSASGAIFLILELNSPLEGLIKASSAPLRDALALLGR